VPQKAKDLAESLYDCECPLPPEISCLPPLSEVDPKTREIWESTTTGLPKLVEAEECFTDRPPSYDDVWQGIFNAAYTDEYDITRNGETIEKERGRGKSSQDRRNSFALAMLGVGDRQERNPVIKVFNIWKHGLPGKMHLPGAAQARYTPLQENCSYAANITTPGSVTYLHHGKNTKEHYLKGRVVNRITSRFWPSASSMYVWR